jgi:pimeloyl-ACP methyl ester carboxylesterase
MNLYGYVQEDPVNREDTFGLTDIFVGGAGDRTFGAMKSVYNQYKAAHPERNAQYVSWRDGAKISSLIAGAARLGAPINVIGHSFGGPEALFAAGRSSFQIDNLITLDPVGGIRGAGMLSKPDSVGNWLNVVASPSHSNQSDFISSLGGKSITLNPDEDVHVDTNHANVDDMLENSGVYKILGQSYSHGSNPPNNKPIHSGQDSNSTWGSTSWGFYGRDTESRVCTPAGTFC